MRKIYYYNLTTQEETPATSDTDKERYKYHQIAVEWYRNGATVDIVDAETGEVVLIWEH